MNTAPFSARTVEFLLRFSLALVYAWFGLLKLLETSPAHDLVAATLPIVSPETAVTTLGLWEVALAVLLLIPRCTVYTLTLFGLHMAGTFLPLLTLQEVTWTEGTVGLTLTGQYILKNVVFLAAGAAIWHFYGLRRIPTGQ